jgi:hypothetical protein
MRLPFEETGEDMGIFCSFDKHVLVSAVVLFALSSLPSTVQGQWGGAPPATTGIGAGSGGIGDGSRVPFHVKLSGTLNPTTPKGVLRSRL